MIKTEHLSKNYRKKVAVNDISFQVETGKVTGFLGPNGAGKSTTMRLMLGLDNGKGTTLYDGKKLHEYSLPAQIVGVLLEAKAFHPTRLAKRHLSVLADASGVSKSRVSEALDMVGLLSEANHKPGKFSLGMAQRLGIAAAILGNPKYLILDEPANGLDPEGIAWLRDFLKDYAGRGNAVFISSHLLAEMSLMADNVVVIGKGKLIISTSMKQLIAGNSHSNVYVRSSELTKLETLFKEKSFSFEKADGGLEVADSSTDNIGKLAFNAGIPVLELSNRSASLEDVFLELTEGVEEFRAHVNKQKGSKS
jgi:ABC-2 type transport system ATP-binding protein